MRFRLPYIEFIFSLNKRLDSADDVLLCPD